MRLAPFLLLFACAAQTSAVPLLPDFRSAEFGETAPDNPYFPLSTGPVQVLLASGEDEDGPFSERSEVQNVGPGRVIMGVQTTAQLDRAFEDGVLVEETRDYFATDAEGNVWYMGEDVTNYRYDDDGTFLGTDDESAWIAGENGASPGWIMPAAPVVGQSYYQEFAEADEALDQARIFAVGQTVTLSDGTVYDDVVVTYETNPLETDAREFKFYAPGVGLIRVEEGLSPELGDPELVFEVLPGA